MRTAISEFDSADADLGFDTVPRAERRPARVGVPSRERPAAVGNRRPRCARPASARVDYRRVRTRATAGDRDRGLHPMARVERARVGFATLAVTAVLSATAVGGLIGVAQWRSGAPGAERTTVVQVQSGESLSDVAARIAPGEPVWATVRKIVELNGLRGAEVTAGRTLVVPARSR
ncbi:LysM peptidoglycan-binding domain-containing protein [Nocardia transvalensis]|uniref:LysM peptidoglycan-binding domain-containing protein n=1 Tax=Nocardia transvalensis TaxID=37333 RepID=UPI001895249B|nr:LysM peptidoglycan-binding domain-containing protein [Nocardia transvalensis]MBF6329649.1 LysM peptidoglycan-binding domain-containing protein [Nocardia transvalensis]